MTNDIMRKQLLKVQTTANTVQVTRFEALRLKYGSWPTALGDCCEAMFHLNRYAKNRTVIEKDREYIYGLKNNLVKLLYEQGYCTDCFEQNRPLPEQECYRCNSTGKWVSSWLGVPEICNRCGGTGIYRKATSHTIVCFQFNVDGKTYFWHLPKYSVIFNYEVTLPSADWRTGDVDVKPLTLSGAKIAAAKDLLRWILNESGAAGKTATAA